MLKKTLPLALSLLMALSAMQLAGASHMQNYANVATEHDNQGRSDEPDFASTSVFGGTVQNCVIYSVALGKCQNDGTLPQVPGHAAQIAPGCTDDQGRQASGLCGLWTVGASAVPKNTAGVKGMSANQAPGRLSADKGTSIRFLSNVVTEHLAAPSQRMFDYNHAVGDAPDAAKTVLSTVGVGQFVAGYIGEWLWYGDWADKNGNGVIDHLTSCGNNCVDADNEFSWRGNCVDFFGQFNPQSITKGYCNPEPSYAFDWVYPGNHHGGTGTFVQDPSGELGFYVPVDAPGSQAYCLSKLLVDGDVPGQVVFVKDTLLPVRSCPAQISDLDAWSQSEFGSGDFLLDQNPFYAGYDFSFNDRSGDPSATTRHWSENQGYAQFYYDTSIIQSTVKVAAMFGTPGVYDLARAKYTDVDKYTTFSPVLQSLLGASGTVPTATRSQWALVRDISEPANNLAQSFVRTQQTDSTGTTGPVDDKVADPGWAHEPNTGADVFPGATRGTCADGDATFNGWCNSYAGYRAASHGWVDVQATRLVTDNVAFTWNQQLEQLMTDTIDDNLESEVGPCVQCAAGPGLSTTASVGARDAGDHSRAMDPGQYQFLGYVGVWHDTPQTVTERVLAPTTADPLHVNVNTYSVAQDSWIGSIVDTTGDYKYRGYGDASCAVGSNVPFAFCHPYQDGAAQDANSYQQGYLKGEWRGQCQVPTNINTLTLTVDGGVWDFPIIVYRSFEQLELANTDEVEVHTGDTNSITLNMACFDPTTGFFVAADEVFLPAGNLGHAVHTSITGSVNTGTATETVTDYDTYVAFG